MSRTEIRSAKATAKTQRVINSLAVLNAVRVAPLTVTALCEVTGLSRTATLSVVASLIDLGWLSDDAVGTHPGAGRPARLVTMRQDAGLVVGIDIGAHKIQAAVADLSGDVLHRETIGVDPALDAEQRLSAAADLCRLALEKSGHSTGEAWLIAAGSPGVVQDGIVTHFIGLAGWEGLDIASALREKLGRPVIVENDCNLAALAETWKGAAQGVKELVYILAGNRTGAGLILGGELYRGWRGGAGEIGALRDLGWATAPEIIDDVTLDDRPVDRAGVFRAARNGDDRAVAIVDRFGAALAKGISALVLALDPQLVVVGGGVSRAGDTLLEPLSRHVRDLSIVRAPDVKFSSLGDHSVSLGAVRLALNEIEQFILTTAHETLTVPSPNAALLLRAV